MGCKGFVRKESFKTGIARGALAEMRLAGSFLLLICGGRLIIQNGSLVAI